MEKVLLLLCVIHRHKELTWICLPTEKWNTKNYCNCFVLFCSFFPFCFWFYFISFHHHLSYENERDTHTTHDTHSVCKWVLRAWHWRVTESFSLHNHMDYSRFFFAIQNFAHKLIACYKNFNLKFNFRHTVYWALSFVFLQSFFFFLAFHTLYFIWHAAVTERMCVYGIWLIYLNLFETVNEITVFAGVLYQYGLFYTQTFNCMLGYMGIFPYSWAAQQ